MLLAPTRLYVRDIAGLTAAGVDVHAAAHITGGGIPENLPRALPEGLRAVARARIRGSAARRTTPCSPAGGWTRTRPGRTFNMGLGMCVVVDPADVARPSSAACRTRARWAGVEAGPPGVVRG